MTKEQKSRWNLTLGEQVKFREMGLLFCIFYKKIAEYEGCRLKSAKKPYLILCKCRKSTPVAANVVKRGPQYLTMSEFPDLRQSYLHDSQVLWNRLRCRVVQVQHTLPPYVSDWLACRHEGCGATVRAT